MIHLCSSCGLLLLWSQQLDIQLHQHPARLLQLQLQLRSCLPLQLLTLTW
jgi:hypothetical protein